MSIGFSSAAPTRTPPGTSYLYFEHDKKRIKRCLRHTDKRKAIETAKLHIKATLEKNSEVATLLMHRRPASAFSTIGEIFTTLEADSPTKSAHSYTLALGDVKMLSSGVLDEKTGQAYFAAAEMKVAKAAKAASQQLAQRLKRSANSVFNQAKMPGAI